MAIVSLLFKKAYRGDWKFKKLKRGVFLETPCSLHSQNDLKTSEMDIPQLTKMVKAYFSTEYQILAKICRGDYNSTRTRTRTRTPTRNPNSVKGYFSISMSLRGP
jgi:hypothetical protein